MLLIRNRVLSNRAKTSGRQRRSVQIEARERKVCTIAFLDIVQSTALIEDLDPEDALDRLGPAVEMIMDTCEEFGASVRFVGDGALAVFGFPVADENHSIRAVEAGLTSIERILGMETDRVDLRVGIHSGPVLFGNLSHSSFDELTLTGPVVNLADKIQAAANVNTVTVSETVVNSVGEMFLSQKVGSTQVSGIDQPFPLFEILGRDQSVSRWRNRIGRGLSPFTGRESDLATLNSAWDSCRQGKGSAIGIVGEAGIGKSRLLHEFNMMVDRTHSRVLEVSATALDKKAAYAPLTRALKIRLGLSSKDDDAAFVQKVSPYLDTQSPDFGRRVNALKLVLHSQNADLSFVELGPKPRQDIIVDALLSVIVGLAEKLPFVIIFEDMHWADNYTHSLCRELVQMAPASQMMAVLTSRNIEVIRRSSPRTMQKMHLSPLENEASRTLIRKLLSRDGEKANLSIFIDKICGQTPLFIEEIIRNFKTVGLSADGTIGANFKVPDSVQPLIAQRIDALPPAARQALQIASVIGSEFSVDLLRRLLQKEGLDDAQSLSFLAKLDLLKDIDSSTARFQHALIQQVAYASLPKRRLIYLHGIAFETLKSTKNESSLSMMSSMAYHAEKSKRWYEAAEAYNESGHLALERAAFEDGIMHFERAITCSGQLDPETPEAKKLAMRSRQGLRVAYVPKGDFLQILQITEEVERLARDLGDDASALGAGIDQVMMKTVLSDVASVIPKGTEILDIAVQSGRPGYIATAAFALSQAYWFTGSFEKAVQLSRRFEHFYEPEKDRLTNRTTGSVSVLGMGTYANALSMLRDFEEAERVCDRMAAVCAETEKSYDITFHAISAGIRALQMGNFERSRESLSFALQTAEQSKIDVLRGFLSSHLAKAHAGLKDLDAARQALDMGYDIARPADMSAFLAHLMAAEISIFSESAPSQHIKDLRTRLAKLCRKKGYGGL